jgi:ABC-2 type transport system ATP-binding protein
MAKREFNDGTAITVSGVYKDFILPHEKKTSVKSVFTGMFRGRAGSEHQHALKDISFEVRKGEFFGIVGRNGSGKSTLLKILAGIYQPTRGGVQLEGKLVPFIELGVGFNPELTGRENVYLNGALLGFSEKEIDAQYEDIVQFAELERFMDQKLKNYSSGMQVRLAFSLATRAQADILLVDEVLAVGDAAFQRKCFEYFKELKAKKKTVVFVTHDMSAVREYCDRAMLIDDSEMQLIGDPQDVAREYSLLFMDNKARQDQDKKDSGKRWGNGAVHMDDVQVTLTEKELRVDVQATATEAVDKVIYGLHIIGQDGTEITAMNNRMLHVPDIENVRAGQKISFGWSMQNIFNDGKFYVTLTLVDDVANTLDWYTKAASFHVTRLERSTTPVLPPVTVTTTVSKEASSKG